ncbi:Cys-tRNA(Pro) deacylase [Breznakia pachnodae]|uniref:Cys-tRNA(Pro)/Cys-tRNA(Cys) deacylase n=1 Tax=Breznakia pachnodae TaxID=265178 RepID=A0ABU0DYW6_9FIRM|nr:Cys-tRNA(Pro) deacylase [Breznakia pachnodae]MDQ0359837.1 Cys-tRNA(Pro)/Cys-tRNA(Cys) deacylase [Breznakia pachnodae]
MKKTNAMRILDQHKITYNMYEYEVGEEFDSHKVANKIHKPEELIYKTLVTIGKSKHYYVFIVPVEKELDLKKAAKAAKEKSIEMIAVKEINKVTGYVRGGCSPIGMKKVFPTFCDSSALAFDTIIVSGGKIGLQIELDPQKLSEILPLTFEEVC